MGDLTFSVLSVPYLVLAMVLLAAGVATVVVRGDTVIRISLLVLAAVATPWAGAFVIAGSTTDAALAEHVLRIGIGPTALVGPGLMMLILAVSGRFDAHRGLLAFAFACGVATSVVSWVTDWTVAGIQVTPWGLQFPLPGWFQLVHIGQIPLWGVVGLLISRRGMRATLDERWRSQRRRAALLVALATVTVADALLAHGIVGVYPMAWLPALIGGLVALHAIFRADLFRARGLDVPAAVELAALAAITAFLYAVTWGGDNRSWTARPVVTAVFLAPLPMLGLVAAWTLRIRRRRAERASDVATSAIDRFAEEVRDLPDEGAVAARLAELLAAHAPVSDVRVWAMDEAGAASALLPPDAAPPRIDPRVRAWLIANAEPLVVAELTTTRLGGLRSLVEDAVERLASDVVIPLVDRDALVGVAVAALPPYRVLRDGERDFVRSLATTAARGLTFMSLTREAAHLASTAREVELAEAIQHARATGDVTLEVGPWQVLGHYRPAARVAGDVWSCADLGDGRVLLFVGDVAGRGVPSALVSAAVGGVCEAAPALRGGELDPRGLLELAHQTVRDLGRGNQRVAAFAAVLDPARGVVRFATAGQRGGYLVHPPPDGEARARLDLLAARSTPLGEPALVLGEGERALGDDDLVVACSDGVVEIRDARGEPWGDRRLQRMLRDQLLGAGDRAARMIVAASVAHAGESAIADDMLVVVVRRRPGGGGSGPARPADPTDPS